MAFVKHGDEWLVMMNDDDVPTLRLNPAYRKLLTKEGNDRDTRNYVKERFKSAVQLIKNIEQRKQTILKVCYTVVTRQRDFLEAHQRNPKLRGGFELVKAAQARLMTGDRIGRGITLLVLRGASVQHLDVVPGELTD